MSEHLDPVIIPSTIATITARKAFLPSNMATASMQTDLQTLEDKFYRACDQIILIDRKLKDMSSRYAAANKNGQRSMRYNRRLQLVTLEGVRAAYYQYAQQAAEKMTALRCQLYGEEVLMDEDSYDSDY